MFKRILTKKKTICILSGILLILIVWTAWGSTALELSTYTIGSRGLPDAFDGYRIAQVSDLHNAEFGDGNQRLLNMLREAEPDMIAITGDLIDSRKTNIAAALAFAEEAVRIAPCYYVSGNHEARVPKYRELKAELEAAAVTLLDNARVLIAITEKSNTNIGDNDPRIQTYY